MIVALDKIGLQTIITVSGSSIVALQNAEFRWATRLGLVIWRLDSPGQVGFRAPAVVFSSESQENVALFSVLRDV